ncbi:hypothetical protein [Sulfurovum sp. NBC37-1]|uniref:hypothetical protein n=1 Tax=Sulfurovum sp. (strain NBC37-1) TaxID=387093 RepID=UPI000158746B|nr:hypothetical protein [Sulfurovum sp. NBC37-1]BAF71434.1 hypothetical protein SUN_0474 [Sulfurovum sp. NBC37-1]
MGKPQKDALDKAREAFRLGNYVDALENYDYFFEHALDDDPASSYGVRLSYCLSEWVKLGEKYPEALIRLKSKRDEALDLLLKTKEPERFHDYVAICEYLKSSELPVNEFIKLHDEESTLSQDIVRFIWDKLIKKEKWKICNAYLPNPEEKYKEALTSFNIAMKYCKSNPEYDIERQMIGSYVMEIYNILLVLMKNNRIDAAKSVRKQVIEDFNSRGYTGLMEKIDKEIGLEEA